MTRLNAEELRDISEDEAQKHAKELKRRPLYLILENIYDTYNIGGLFRLADAMAVSKIYICGDSETPPNHKIKKASVGTYKIVPWEYCPSASQAIRKLKEFSISNSQFSNKSETSNFKSENTPQSTSPALHVYAIEQSENSTLYTNVEYELPLALVLGNETSGVTQETLQSVDQIVEIPMWGVNKSLNVIVSAGIVGYHIISQQADKQ